MDLNFFTREKNLLRSNYEEMLSIADSLGLNDIQSNILDYVESLKQDNFNIVVVGEFSRGKSTFINALLGKRVLPSATKPTTTVINKITSGEQIEYVLYFREDNKAPKVISEEDFKQLVAISEPDFDNEAEIEEYNQYLDYLSSIAYVNIKYPTKLLEDGVEIIDTPGTNDLDQAREEITFQYIPKSDAAIMVLSATQILSESEIAFLKERILANDINKIFFVINAKDKLMTREDEQKVFDYALKHLKKYVPKPKVYLVSSRGALNYKRKTNGEIFKGKVPANFAETGFDTLEGEIANYFINERGRIKLDKYYHRGTKIASEINNHINLKLSTTSIPLQELEQKVNNLLPKLGARKNQALQLLNQMKTTLIGLENDYISTYQNGLEEIALKAKIAVSSYDGPLEIENVTRHVEQTVAPLQKNLLKKMEDYKIKYIDSKIQETVRMLYSYFDDLNVNISSQFLQGQTDVALAEGYDEITVHSTEKSAEEDVIVDGLILGSLAAAVLFSAPLVVVPAAFFGGKYIESMFQSKRKVNFLEEVKVQIGRRYEEIIPKQVETFHDNYSKSINQAISSLESQVNQKIKRLEKQLQKLLEEKRLTESKVNKEINNLRNMQSQLKNIITQFKKGSR
ncbi:MAG: hypothetical protein GX958_08705 [Desulfitobacterium sp.]|nr:hypothetical protein [Desulfitobacterium sp.]